VGLLGVLHELLMSFLSPTSSQEHLSVAQFRMGDIVALRQMRPHGGWNGDGLLLEEEEVKIDFSQNCFWK
jgi:hypothetical protein